MASPTLAVPSVRFDYRTIRFALFHVGTLAAVVLSGWSWWGLLLAIASYYARMFVVTMGYHRYFSHRSFSTSRVFQFVLAFLAMTSAQKGVIWWASHHRRHHRYSDQPGDVHSPRLSGFWWSHVGWIVSAAYEEAEVANVPDLLRYPELRWLDRWPMVPPVAYGAAWLLAGGWHGLLWGMFVSTVILWHGTFTINSLAHVIGVRRFATTDDSRNHLGLAVITCGEGWHNNHHHYQGSAAQGFYRHEIDLTWYGLKALRALGLVWDLHRPPERLLEGMRDVRV